MINQKKSRLSFPVRNQGDGIKERHSGNLQPGVLQTDQWMFIASVFFTSYEYFTFFYIYSVFKRDFVFNLKKGSSHNVLVH